MRECIVVDWDTWFLLYYMGESKKCWFSWKNRSEFLYDRKATETTC